MSIKSLAVFLSLFFVPCIAQAQSTPSEVSTNATNTAVSGESSNTALVTEQTSETPDASQTASSISLKDALAVTPPQRKNAGIALAQNPDNLREIDTWITNTTIDHPDNLKLKDLLMAMPIALSGPRLAELAKKTNDPAVQNSWTRWLSKYPDVHASVLIAWLINAKTNPAHFIQLLNDYAAVNPNGALNIWIQLRANHPASELHHAEAFGYDRPGCADAISQAIISDRFQGEIAMLRLFTTLVSCADSPKLAETTSASLLPKLSALLDHKLPSRRIVAIDVIGATSVKQPQIIQKLTQIFKDAQNTTERAHALRSLHLLQADGQTQRLTEALTKGDETLRFEAAALIAASPNHQVDLTIIKTAFGHEKWPDTQLALYATMTQAMPDDAAKSQFQKQILFDASRSEALRGLALKHLAEASGNLITLDDMAKLTTDGASLNLIATTAEYIYASQVSSRPTLRNWLIAQQPFERRILATFISFIRVDTVEKDASAIESVRMICEKAPEQDNILQPCIFYLSEHAQSDADKSLLEALQKRKNQFDAMMNLDF